MLPDFELLHCYHYDTLILLWQNNSVAVYWARTVKVCVIFLECIPLDKGHLDNHVKNGTNIFQTLSCNILIRNDGNSSWLSLSTPNSCSSDEEEIPQSYLSAFPTLYGDTVTVAVIMRMIEAVPAALISCVQIPPFPQGPSPSMVHETKKCVQKLLQTSSMLSSGFISHINTHWCNAGITHSIWAPSAVHLFTIFSIPCVFNKEI